MANHVRVGEVDQQEPEATLGEPLAQHVGDRNRAHRGGEVIGRDIARRIDQAPLLPRPQVLATPVEEVGHVWVLLGFGHVQLADPLRGQHVGEHLGQRLGRVSDRRGELLGVLGHLHEIRPWRILPTVELVKSRLDQRPSEFAGPIGAEVEEDHGVVGVDPTDAGISDHRRGE